MPDLVVTDIAMPHATGFDLVTNLRADPRWSTLPVIAVTAYARAEDKAGRSRSAFTRTSASRIAPRTLVAVAAELREAMDLSPEPYLTPLSVVIGGAANARRRRAIAAARRRPAPDGGRRRPRRRQRSRSELRPCGRSSGSGDRARSASSSTPRGMRSSICGRLPDGIRRIAPDEKTRRFDRALRVHAAVDHVEDDVVDRRRNPGVARRRDRQARRPRQPPPSRS